MMHLSSTERQDLIRKTSDEARTTDAKALATVILNVLKSATSVFEGKIQALEPLKEEHGLERLYDWLVVDWNTYLRVLTHSKPRLRILEIGAGTGGTTASVFTSLLSERGHAAYAAYTFTDVSAGFFGAAKERFSHIPNLEFAILDISKDPELQGFQPQAYDLILAANVIHATPSIHESLCNIRKLLKPSGRLLLQELAPEMRCLNYIMGLLPGWWLGENDGRSLEPFMTMERWRKELQRSGFEGSTVGIYDDEYPYHVNMSIISTPSAIVKTANKMAFLCEEGELVDEETLRPFINDGYRISCITLEQDPPDDSLVVSLLDLSRPFLSDMDRDRWTLFKRFMANIKQGLLWVTHSIQSNCNNAEYGMILGVARSLRSELSVHITTLEIDEIDSNAWIKILEVSQKIQCIDRNASFDPDYEYALVKGEIQVGRFQWSSMTEELSAAQKMLSSDPSQIETLDIGTFGLLNTLQWKQKSGASIKADEVLVDIHYVGMNFRDVLVAMGQVDEMQESLGSDGSGIVVQTGSEVSHLAVGDRVIVLAKGCFVSRMTLSASKCVGIPTCLSLEDAATMPSVYSTVIHGLIDLGALESGQVRSCICFTALLTD